MHRKSTITLKIFTPLFLWHELIHIIDSYGALVVFQETLTIL
jgi:hypothetical protein